MVIFEGYNAYIQKEGFTAASLNCDSVLGHFYSFAYIVTQIWNEDEVTKSKNFHPDADRFKAARLIWLFLLGLGYPMQMKDK